MTKPPSGGAGRPPQRMGQGGPRPAGRPAARAPGIGPRAAALELILAVMQDGRMLSDLTGEGGPLMRLPGPERARAQRLAISVLRNLGRADQVLRPHLRKNPPAAVRAILELATVEMLEEGAPPHGAVNVAVALVREGGRKTESFAGLVNAVLRRVAETTPEDWDALPPQPLPAWLRGRLTAAWGRAAVTGMEAAHQRGAPVDITPKVAAEAAELAEALGGIVLPTGSIRIAAGVQLSDLPGFAEGRWWVQDAAAALPALVLAAQPGERVLDLCAAPGGKTLQLAAAGAAVTALDISQPRLVRLHENLARCGLGAEVVVADALNWQAPEPFDAILLDAPCSATGTIRRHPDLPHLRDPEALKDLFALQARLIDRAAQMLRPGGRLVFCTCSILPEEGEKQVPAALARNPGLRVDTGALVMAGVDPAWGQPGPGLRLRPDFWADRGGIDGFFVAAFRRET